jgi:hypothetical protein
VTRRTAAFWLFVLSVISAGCGHDSTGGGAATAKVGATGDPPAAIRTFCTACHLFPPPDTLPRASWKKTIDTMYEISRGSLDKVPEGLPPLADVLSWYTQRAPETLRSIDTTVKKGPGKLRAEGSGLRIGGLDPFPAVANVKFVHLYDERRLDLLVTDLRTGMVFAVRPYLAQQEPKLLGAVKHPCTSEVVDLDQDGNLDLLVADLGTPTPSDVTTGALFWFRGDAARNFTVMPLVTGLGRTAHAQAADFDADGDRDIVLAVFGWRKVGAILLLDNETTDWSSPRFTPYTLDPRPGAIHVPVADLDADGDTDFVALISQQFETVEAYLNDGTGEFNRRTVFAASHPNWGSTGIQLVDLDQDGDLDVVFSNGDSLDDLVVKPYHGIQWLENRGAYPFADHRLTDLYGCNAAKAADLDGDGDLDIAASVFLPYVRPGDPGADLLESIIWLEQTAPGRFERFSIEHTATLHPTLDLGDYDADGDVDLVVGNMRMQTREADVLPFWAVLWTNRLR